MLEWLQQGLNDSRFMPHGHCFLWTPGLLWLYLIADGLTALAYFSIPPALWYFARKRTDFQYGWLVVLFGVFITACGATHVIKLWNIWHAAYWLDGWVALLTGVVSMGCAIAVWPIIPKMLALPGRGELEAAYAALSEQNRQLAENESRHRLLLETAAEGVWVLDREGNTTYANAAMAQMLGCSEIAYGRSWLDFVYDEDCPSARIYMRRRIAGISEKHEFRLRRVDGTPIYTIISTAPVPDSHGEVVGMLGYITDITERVQMDRQLKQLNRELEKRVEQRTAELERSNLELAREMVVREYVQDELKASNEQLNHYLRELQKHNDDITRLNVLSDRLHACNERDELLRVLAHGCRDLFECQGGALFEWRGDQLCLLDKVWGDGDELAWPLQANARAALRQGILFPNGIEQQDACGAQVRTRHGFVLCAPLQTRGANLGVLVITREEPFWSGEALTDQKLGQIVHALTEHTALALNNLTLRDQLREQSVSDPLTGLYNRRYLYEQMAHEMARWERSREPFALILLDIDHFKQFNDRYGHDLGDEVLIALAGLLLQHVRKSDVACRLGGEEFVVLLAGADQLQALSRAETIREAVKTLRLTRLDQGHTISISAGVAVFPEHGGNAQTLIRAADEALYESKRQGRDRTSLADQPQAQPG